MTRQTYAPPEGKDHIRPRWERSIRTLWWQDQVVKQFGQPADQHECILDAFQRSRWVRWTLNPLPRASGSDRKEQLRNAIKNLNRYQKTRRIRFRADGRGQGIRWEPI
jgi:hypothetical protein